MPEIHESHVTRGSKSLLIKVLCVNCGANDGTPKSSEVLALPCTRPPSKGGTSKEELEKQEQERLETLKESLDQGPADP